MSFRRRPGNQVLQQHLRCGPPTMGPFAGLRGRPGGSPSRAARPPRPCGRPPLERSPSHCQRGLFLSSVPLGQLPRPPRQARWVHRRRAPSLGPERRRSVDPAAQPAAGSASGRVLSPRQRPSLQPRGAQAAPPWCSPAAWSGPRSIRGRRGPQSPRAAARGGRGCLQLGQLC